jgi:LuxR family maltose regulon positive regulatory protein
MSVQAHSQIPFTPVAIERPRLLDRLEQASAYRITLITAPTGYGKTTAVSQWARKTPVPVAWHSIEEHERDLPNLHRHALSALEDIAPGIEQALLPITDSSAGELAAAIAEYLRRTLVGSAAYVLDDAQHLSGSPGAETWLHTLTDRSPPGLHLIIASQGRPDLPYLDLVAHSQVTVLDDSVLRMTADEIGWLAERTLGRLPSDEELDDLISHLDGWPAGVMLALHPLHDSLADVLAHRIDGPRALFETLAEQMLRAQLPDLRHFLLTSSTLRRLTPELCNNVLGLRNSSEWLAEAQSRNLFLSRVSGGLVYHQLFRDFLQNKLREEDPERFVELHLRAARRFQEQDDVDNAFTHYLTAGHADTAARLAEQASLAYYGQGRFETMLDWSDRLKTANASAPSLALQCSYVLTDRYEYERAEEELKQAQAGYEQQGDERGSAQVQVQQARIYVQHGELERGIKLAEPLTQVDSPELRGRALRTIGTAYLRSGDVDMSIAYLEKALEVHRELELLIPLSHLLQDLQVAYMRLGRFKEGGEFLQEAVALRRKLGGRANLAHALNNLGYYYQQFSDYYQALLTFQDGLGVVAGSPNRRVEGYLLWSMGDLRRDLGAFDAAQRLYDKALDLLPQRGEPNLQSSILASVATMRRWQNRQEEAVLVAEEALRVAEAQQLPFEAARAEAAAWAARSQLGQAADAVEHLADVIEELRRQGARFELTGVLGIAAHACLLAEDEDAARAYIDAALQVAEEIETAQPLAVEIAHTLELKEFVDGLPENEQLARDLMRWQDAKVELAGDVEEEPTTRNTTYTLSVHTLGDESVGRDGTPVTDWRSAVAREIFFYLLFEGAQRRDTIGSLFWPDFAPRKVRNNFHATMHRARQALGPNVIVFEDDIYRINPDVQIHCDALDLERVVDEARSLPPHDARAAHLWERAVHLYKGEFLPSLDYDWVLPRRIALHEMYIEAMVGMGHCARARDDTRGAIDILKQALEVEPYREDIHRTVMRYYADLGEKNQVVNHFNRLQARLRDEIGVAPAEETVRLAERLLKE